MNTTGKNFIALMFIIIGLFIGIAIMGTISLNYPEQMRGVEKLLDKDKYTVDTTITIHGSDTIYKYKFVKK